MDLTYPIIIKNKKSLAKGFCLLLTALLLCIQFGCASPLPQEESVEEELKSPDLETGKAKPYLEKPAHETADAKDEDGDRDAQTDGRLTMSQLIGNDTGESMENPDTPDTVLWFNATYAPLTYSNAGNWRLVGGLPPTEDNVRLVSRTLEWDWEITDRESGLEQIAWLKEEGHRTTWRKYLEEMDELGWLELKSGDFLKALTDSGKEDNVLYRYVIVYTYYQLGETEETIAAWDLVRINQLYGDFYLCGYMTYEEAMDASLENSLILQQMYSSWDEMMESYIIGYQFWRNDLAMTEDSPALQRYSYYEMLKEMENGPYSLNWNMKLKKSW